MKIQGRVKWFKDSKGFGFILSEGVEYFIHYSHIISNGFKSLPMGADVQFKPMKGAKGMEAHEVEIIYHSNSGNSMLRDNF